MADNDLQDNPCTDEDFDCTDAACPAWWRGYNHGYISTVNAINQMLDKYDKGDYNDHVPFGGEELNKLVARLKKLYTKEQ